MKPRVPYWFPAKRFGWGWGPPVTWQGWVVLIVWFAAFALGLRLLRPFHLAAGLAYVTAMSALLVIVCYLKGEPPRWRWGKSD